MQMISTQSASEMKQTHQKLAFVFARLSQSVKLSLVEFFFLLLSFSFPSQHNIVSINNVAEKEKRAAALSSDIGWPIRNNFLINLSLITRTVSKWHPCHTSNCSIEKKRIFQTEKRLSKKASFNHLSFGRVTYGKLRSFFFRLFL